MLYEDDDEVAFFSDLEFMEEEEGYIVVEKGREGDG